MKKLIFLLFIFPALAMAQTDTIFKRDDKIIVGTITLVNDNSIFYTDKKGYSDNVELRKVKYYSKSGVVGGPEPPAANTGSVKTENKSDFSSLVKLDASGEVSERDKYHGMNAGLFAEDEESYYVKVMGDIMAVDGYIQKYDKKTNKMIYSSPVKGMAPKAAPMTPPGSAGEYFVLSGKSSDKSLYLIRFKSEKENIILSYQAIDKADGKIFEEVQFSSIPDNKKAKREVSLDSIADKLIVKVEDHAYDVPQNIVVMLFDKNTFKLLSRKEIPAEIDGSLAFVNKIKCNDKGAIGMLFYKVKDQKELNLWKGYVDRGVTVNAQLPGLLQEYTQKRTEPLFLEYINQEGIFNFIPQVDLGPFTYKDYNACKLEFKDSLLIVSGIFGEKDEIEHKGGSPTVGFYYTEYNAFSKKNVYQSFQKFNQEVNDKCVRSIYNRVDPVPLSHFEYHLSLNKRVGDNVYFVANPYSITIRTNLNIIAGKLDLKSQKFEWVNPVPYASTVGSAEFYIGVQTFINNDKLFLVHLDNPENLNMDIYDFDPAQIKPGSLKGGNCVAVTINKDGRMKREVLYTNTKDLYACPANMRVRLANNKMLLHFRGRGDNGAFDEYRAITCE